MWCTSKVTFVKQCGFRNKDEEKTFRQSCKREIDIHARQKRLCRSITRSLICSRHGPRQEEVQASALKFGCTSCLRLDPASQANVLVSIAAASFHCNVDRSHVRGQHVHILPDILLHITNRRSQRDRLPLELCSFFKLRAKACCIVGHTVL